MSKIVFPEITSLITLTEVLLSQKDPKLAAFNAKLVPTESPARILGVRMPLLRKLAKHLLSQERKTHNTEVLDTFMQQESHAYLEEDQLHMILVTERPRTLKGAIESIERFAPRAQCWVLTDGLVPRVFAEAPLEAKPTLMRWLHDDSLWMQRIALVNLISLCTDEYFDKETMYEAASVAQAQQEPLSAEYYINMALAWYLSMCLVKHPQESIAFLAKETLPVWVHNKTLQKTRESRLCSAELKEITRSLKR